MQAQAQRTEKELDWLERRRKGIGGTDAACILGLNRYKGPYEVYCEKLGLVSKPVDNAAMMAGRLMEPVIAQWFSREYGVNLQKAEMIAHPKYEWLLASADYTMLDRREGLDCKLSLSPYRAKEWGFDDTDEIPSEYWVQGQHYLYVYDYKAWHFPVVLGDGQLHHYVVEPDAEFHKVLFDECQHFWHEHVLAQVPPAPGAHSLCREYVHARYPTHGVETIDVTQRADAREIIGTYREARDLFRAIELHKTSLENALKEMIGNDAGLSWEDGDCTGKLTWKARKASTKIDYKAIVQEVVSEASSEIAQQMAKLIAQHTKTVPGPRVFLVSGDWTRPEESSHETWQELYVKYKRLEERMKALGISNPAG